MSSRNAGIWLAAQGALAVIRLGTWVIDPAFDDHQFYPYNHFSPRLSELRLGLISNGYLNKEFWIPVWAAKSLQGTTSKLYQPFTMAFSAYLGRQNPGLDLMAKLQNATEYWDMPEALFMAWVNTHSHPDLPLPMPKEPFVDMGDCGDCGARVIVDNDGSCHVLPFYILEERSFEWIYELKLFGNLKDEASTVVCIRKSKRKQPWEPETFTVGFSTPIGIEFHYTGRPTSAEQFIDENFFGAWRSSRAPDGTIIDGVRDDVIKTMDTMWKDLKHTLKRIANHEQIVLPDIFLQEAESTAQEPPEIRAEPISADSETSNIRRRRQSC